MDQPVPQFRMGFWGGNAKEEGIILTNLRGVPGHLQFTPCIPYRVVHKEGPVVRLLQDGLADLLRLFLPKDVAIEVCRAFQGGAIQHVGRIIHIAHPFVGL